MKGIILINAFAIVIGLTIASCQSETPAADPGETETELTEPVQSETPETAIQPTSARQLVFDVADVPGDWVLQSVVNIATGTVTPTEMNRGVVYQLFPDSTGNIHTEREEEGPMDMACRWIWSDTVLYVSEPNRTNVFVLEQLDDTALVVRVDQDGGFRLSFRRGE